MIVLLFKNPNCQDKVVARERHGQAESAAVASSLDRILENPKLANIFRWQRWLTIAACMTRLSQLTNACLRAREARQVVLAWVRLSAHCYFG